MSGTVNIGEALEEISQRIKDGIANPLSSYAHLINEDPALKVRFYSHAAACYADYIIRVVMQMPQILSETLDKVNSYDNVKPDDKIRILQGLIMKILNSLDQAIMLMVEHLIPLDQKSIQGEDLSYFQTASGKAARALSLYMQDLEQSIEKFCQRQQIEKISIPEERKKIYLYLITGQVHGSAAVTLAAFFPDAKGMVADLCEMGIGVNGFEGLLTDKLSQSGISTDPTPLISFVYKIKYASVLWNRYMGGGGTGERVHVFTERILTNELQKYNQDKFEACAQDFPESTKYTIQKFIDLLEKFLPYHRLNIAGAALSVLPVTYQERLEGIQQNAIKEMASGILDIFQGRGSPLSEVFGQSVGGLVLPPDVVRILRQGPSGEDLGPCLPEDGPRP
ncbi:MAG: hypothetical protein JNL76_05315 [Alphaproteobacteria bacterium]|nr:hypothetical protein [Alphaproteobacteria bacterium]